MRKISAQNLNGPFATLNGSGICGRNQVQTCPANQGPCTMAVWAYISLRARLRRFSIPGDRKPSHILQAFHETAAEEHQGAELETKPEIGLC